ncbi:unnamed protein product [Choristocarpus tenellus]
MGVHGLSSYIKVSPQSFSDHVDITSLVEERRARKRQEQVLGQLASTEGGRIRDGKERGTDSNENIERLGGEAVCGNIDIDDDQRFKLAVDGIAMVYHIMANPGKHQLHLELGCDYLALTSAIKDYLVSMLDSGICPTVIVDGMQVGQVFVSWLGLGLVFLLQ